MKRTTELPDSPRGRRRAFAVAALLLVLAAVALRALFLHAAFSNFQVNADEALNFLQARAIARGDTSLFFWTQPYQFPFEAYLLSYVVDYLPWNAVGARSLQIALCLSAIIGFLLLYREIASIETAWPGILLLLFPSTYWLTRQVGLMTPQHSMMAVFAWMLPLIVVLAKSGSHARLWALAGGAAAGMSISNHLLSLSLASAAGLSLCLGRSPREAAKNTAWFLPGFLLGAAPYLYAKLFIPGAYERVADALPLAAAAERVWSPVISGILPLALGIEAFIVPDAEDKIRVFHFMAQPAALFFAALLVSVTLLRARRFLQRFSADRWPTVEVNDVFVLTSWLALVMLASTGMELRARYALHLVWCFPFILSYAYAAAPRVGRVLIGSAALVFVALNIAQSYLVLQEWRRADFSDRYAWLSDLEPLYKYFARDDVTRCYAGWWLAYRIIFDSQEKIICSPPYNDRFRRWPQPPYRRTVDLSSNTPYVTGRYIHRLLRVGYFERYLLHHRIIADRRQIGRFKVYRNFRHRDVPVSALVPPNSLVAASSHNADLSERLIDGDLKSVWSSGEPQERGMWVELKLDRRLSVHALRMFSRDKVFPDETPRLRVEAAGEDGQWRTLHESVVGHPYKLKLAPDASRHPYDALELMVGFEPIEASRLRLTIEEPIGSRSWRLAEIQVFTAGG